MTTTEVQKSEGPKDYTEVDGTLGASLNFYASEVQEYAGLVARLKAADGDREAALKDYMDNSSDAEVSKLRNAIAAAQAKMRTLAEKNVQDEQLDDAAKGELVKQRDELKEKVRLGQKAIRDFATTMKSTLNYDAVIAALDEIGNPASSGRGRKPGTIGASGPKASVNITVTNGNDSWEFKTFSESKKVLGADLKTIQQAYADAAGVQLDEISSVDKPLNFTLETTNGKFQISTTPKARKNAKAAEVKEY